MIWLYFSAVAALMWLGLVLLPWRPWSTRESLDSDPGLRDETPELCDVTALIPARNEAAHIADTLRALAAQGRGLRIVMVDDQSTDATAECARASGVQGLQIVSGKDLPAGWSGKLWALEQGRPRVRTAYVLLIDADIQMQPGMLATLREKMQREDLALVSLMAWLRMEHFWERLLLPAFVYFFKLVYPFALSNNPRIPRVAAAAGGCILLKTDVLEELGGFASLRDALIDDCTLARRVKARGHRTWIGLTHSVHSLRAYRRLSEIWDMVARTAFTQLHYSALLLLLVGLLMVSAFWVPVSALAVGGMPARLFALLALGAMALAYLPTLAYYRRSALWALALPLIGTLFLAMTVSSALRYWRGRRSSWKARVYDHRLATEQDPQGGREPGADA